MDSVRLTICAAAFAAIASAQNVVEDFKCSVPTTVSNANPAVVTCPSPHGFNLRALANTTQATNANNGDTLTVDGDVYTFVTTVNNSNPREILIGASAVATAWNMHNAVNDTGLLEGTIYSSATTAHPTFESYATFQQPYNTLLYRTAGATGIGKSITSSSARLTVDTATTRMEWQMYITGAAGGWASIGTDAVPKVFNARYVSDTTFSLYSTQTTSYNSSGNGSFAGQSLFIQRAHTGSMGPTIRYPSAAQGESWSQKGVLSNGLYKVTLPGCPDPTHELECSMAKRWPEQSQDQGATRALTGFTVSGGIGTITFGSAFPYTAGGNKNIAVGEPIWLRNITDTAGAWTHTVNLENDSTGTTANRLVKYIPGTSRVGKMQNGDLGGAIGICTANCGTSGTATIAIAGLMPCVIQDAHSTGDWVALSPYDDTCKSLGATWSSYPDEYVTQIVGQVQANGSAGVTTNIWWNGLNRAYVVQSMNGPGDGSSVTQITLTVPGYPDGDYNFQTTLPGVIVSGKVVVAHYWISPYIYYAVFPYNKPMFVRQLKDSVGFNSATANYWTTWVKWEKNQKQCGGNDSTTVGTYFQTPGSNQQQGQHYYHQMDPQIYAGQWMRYEYSAIPWHQVGQANDADYFYDLHHQGTFGGWNGSMHWWEGLGSWYLTLSGRTCPPSRNTSGQDIYMTPVMIEAKTAEPFELVKTKVGTWASARYQGGDGDHTPTGTAGYGLWWGWSKDTVVTYEVRYSTTGSLKALGWSTGKCQDGTTTCGASDRVTTTNTTYETGAYSSATMTQQPAIWWGIKPISVALSGVSGNGQNPIWYITRPDMNLEAGQTITTAGIGGNTAANVTNAAITAVQPRQIWPKFDPRPFPLSVTGCADSGGLVQLTVANHNLITGQTIQLHSNSVSGFNAQWVITTTGSTGSTFTLDGSTYQTCSGGTIRLNLPPGSGSTAALTSITSNATASPNTVCTVNLDVNHNIVPGWKFYIYGAPNSLLSNADGITASSYTVTTTPTASTFTFACPATLPTSTTFNTDDAGGKFIVQSYPGFAVSGTGNGAYTSGGTAVCTTDTACFAEMNLAPYQTASQSALRGTATIRGTATVR